MDAQPFPVWVPVVMTLGGAAFLWYLWRCWAGRSRGWTRHGAGQVMVLGPGPSAGFFTLGTGLFWLLGDPVGLYLGTSLFLVAFVLLLPGLGYLLFAPRWWGPRWLRQQRSE